MSHLRGTWLAALLALPLAVAAQSPEPQNADQWLARIAQAGGSLEYQGVLVYAHDGRVEAMRIARSMGPTGPREEIVALNGARRSIVRENGTVRCTDADRGTTEVGRDEFPLLTFDPGELRRAAELYRLALAGNDRMAGLETRVLEARPTDSSRYGYKLWVEPRSGMVLASTLMNPDGADVEQMMFTSINLAPSAAAALANRPPPPPPQPAAAPPVAIAVAPSAWKMGWMPAGFRMIGAPSAASAARSHLLFTDGLAYVSIYIEPIASARPMDGLVRRGAVNLYARPVADNQVVVIGDVPAATAERIARGVERAVQH